MITGRPLAIASIGPMAARYLVSAERHVGTFAGRVSHVFETSFAVEFPEHRFVCVGAAGMDNGPLNAVCRETKVDGWRATGAVEGAAVAVADGLMQLAGGPAFDMRGAVLWQPPPWPSGWGLADLQTGLDALDAVALTQAPEEGLARAVFRGSASTGIAGAVLRSALCKTATIADWLAARFSGGTDAALDAAARAATHGLIGLGPGLTPSGDDLVAGLAIALSAAGQADAAAALAGFVRAAPAHATSALSRAFLDTALAGLPAAAMHAAIAALLSGDEAALAAAVDRLDGVGHTSGWDMLAGAVLGLRAVTHRRSDASLQ